MKFDVSLKVKGPPRPKVEHRVRKAFLFTPLTINNERRWLETVYIREVWRLWAYCSSWQPVDFLTKEEAHYWRDVWKLEII